MEKYKDIEFDIGDQALELLFDFPNVDYLSSYEAYSLLGIGADYKNTHKRVKRLESLGFIEPVKATEVKVEDTKHGAKHYRISEAGMFYLFRKEGDSISTLLPSIIEAHGNYMVFETFLYPYFKKETLLALGYAHLSTKEDLGDVVVDAEKGPIVDILDNICRYIGYCCSAIYEYIIILRAHIPKLKYQEKMALRDRMFKELLDRIAREKDHLVMEIILGYRAYRKAKRLDAQAFRTLAQDDRFMNIAEDVQKDFKRVFDIAIHLRTRS